MQIDNRSGFPHAWFEKTGPGGIVHDVLVLRGTFDLNDSYKPLQRAAKQAAIVYADEYDGHPEVNPLQSVLRREGDLVLLKPASDIYVTGTAHSEGGVAKPGWLAGIRVGNRRKLLQLHGPRRFERHGQQWRLSGAESVTQVPLDYRYAFGGCYSVRTGEQGEIERVYNPQNPAGCGWLPSEADLQAMSPEAQAQLRQWLEEVSELPAPQIEDVEAPVASPHDTLPPQGLAPLARWSQERLQYAGTYDEHWQRERYPLLPDDFDERFYQAAPPDLVQPGYLAGDEFISLLGLLPEGLTHFRLPGVLALVSLTTTSGLCRQGPLVLDTVAIDLDARQVSLIWRGTFERVEPWRRLAVGTLDAPLRQEDVHGA
ncbi:hypothetical protein BVH01_00205 [Pseudomonas sp. PA1(2017)]|uniref:DUF2169 family type VI secretion system accessory protein n=1 Tax=Pseudomonas sp. PA1(2017) TaxID=1932113 RepID=UPI0009598615|nr:DUF2169 domain-containing protein [Pseudomonas sp. PA1(2017)]OLU20400.1 hypothetical protein BVH01_00205 [Pseudomonas sp. PA1(2017)]